jgi:hypothetical protein
MMIVNDNSRVVNKLEDLLTDDTRVTIYDRRMFIVHATEKANRDKHSSLSLTSQKNL